MFKMTSDPQDVVFILFNVHSTLSCALAAERWHSAETVSETSRLQEELSRLPGKSAVQRPQPDRIS